MKFSCLKFKRLSHLTVQASNPSRLICSSSLPFLQLFKGFNMLNISQTAKHLLVHALCLKQKEITYS
jgi:hypothetical protein